MLGKGGKGDPCREMCFHRMAQNVSIRPHILDLRAALQLIEESELRCCHGGYTTGTAEHCRRTSGHCLINEIGHTGERIRFGIGSAHPICSDCRYARVSTRRSSLGVTPLLEHQKCADAAGDEATASLRPLLDAFEGVTPEIVAELISKKQILALSIDGPPDEAHLRLTCRNPLEGIVDRRKPRHFLAHEGARRPRDMVDDRDVAGEEVRELSQEQGRTKSAWQDFTGAQRCTVRRAAHFEHLAVNGGIALAAAGGDDKIHPIEQVGASLDLCIFQSQTSSIHAETLPPLHLSLIAVFGNLLGERQRYERMHRIWRECRLIHASGAGLLSRENACMSFSTFTE